MVNHIISVILQNTIQHILSVQCYEQKSRLPPVRRRVWFQSTSPNPPVARHVFTALPKPLSWWLPNKPNLFCMLLYGRPFNTVPQMSLPKKVFCCLSSFSSVRNYCLVLVDLKLKEKVWMEVMRCPKPDTVRASASIADAPGIQSVNTDRINFTALSEHS